MFADLICHSEASVQVQIRYIDVGYLSTQIDFSFDVRVTQPYSIKYYASYTFGDRRVHRIEILEQDGTDLPKQIHLASEGFYIEYGTQDKDILDPIFVSQGRLQIFDPDNSIRLALYTINPRKFKLIHYIDGEVNWIGYLLPEQYIKPLRLAKSAIEILATDGLGELQSLIYGETFTAPIGRARVRISLKDLFIKILSQLNYNIPFEISFAWYPYGINTERLLEHILINESSLKHRTLYEILQSVLLMLCLRLYQEDGKWIFEQVEHKTKTYIVDRYNYLGVYVDSEIFDGRIDAGFAENSEIKFRSSNGYETFRPGYNKIKLITEVNQRDAIGRNLPPVGFPARLESQVNGYYAKIKNFAFQYWIDDNTPLFVTLSPNAYVQRSTDSAVFDDYSLQINNILGTEYFSFKLDTIQPGQNVGLLLRFYIKRVGTGITLFGLAVRVGEKYARWDTDEGAIIFEEDFHILSHVELDEGYNNALTDNEWQERQLTINNLPPEGGELEIYFFGGITFFGSYQGLRYDLIRPLLISNPGRITYEIQDNESRYDRTKDLRETFITDELVPLYTPRITISSEQLNIQYPVLLESHWKRTPYEPNEQPSGKSLGDMVVETHLLLQNDRLIQRDEEYLQRYGIIPIIMFRNTLNIKGILYIAVWMRKLFRKGLVAGQWVQIGVADEEPIMPTACLQYWDSEFEGQAVGVFKDDFGNYYLEKED